MTHYDSLPYRPCIGALVLNREGLVFVGRRINGPEHVDALHSWQMPQGGIDAGEEPWPAALRELYEETNIRSVEKAGEIAEWLSYDIPREIVGEAWNGRYRGQTQKWFAMRFTGEDSEIDIACAGRSQAGIRRVALGADGTAAGTHHSVQATGVRTGRAGIRRPRGR